MRTLLVCLLVSGCSILDGIADNAVTTPADNRVFLGGDTLHARHRAELDRYTCGREQLVCESAGSGFYCSCQTVTMTRSGW